MIVILPLKQHLTKTIKRDAYIHNVTINVAFIRGYSVVHHLFFVLINICFMTTGIFVKRKHLENVD